MTDPTGDPYSERELTPEKQGITKTQYRTKHDRENKTKQKQQKTSQ